MGAIANFGAMAVVYGSINNKCVRTVSYFDAVGLM